MMLVARLQSTDDTTNASFIQCSNTLAPDTWHHFALALGGAQDAELFVDGKEANNTTTVLDQTLGTKCGDKTSTVAPKQDLLANTEHLPLGASNSTSAPGTTDNLASPFSQGVNDHFRIRSGRFTQEEAFNVYRVIEE